MTSKIAAVLFDWAGTIIDYGSRAPVEVFVEVFRRIGVPISSEEARTPMGMAKREHIAAICRMPNVLEKWRSQFGSEPDEVDIDRLYVDFLELQKSVLSKHAVAIPGASHVFEYLKQREIAIGSSTGYTRDLMAVVAPLAASQGLEPAAIVCADDVVAGRPKPWLIFEALQRLDRFPCHRTVVVDDTTVGIQAGIHAGCWTVAVRKSGNELGLSLEETNSLPIDELNSRLAAIEEKFLNLGADYVIDSVADLPEVIEKIEQYLENSKLPKAYRV